MSDLTPVGKRVSPESCISSQSPLQPGEGTGSPKTVDKQFSLQLSCSMFLPSLPQGEMTGGRHTVNERICLRVRCSWLQLSLLLRSLKRAIPKQATGTPLRASCTRGQASLQPGEATARSNKTQFTCSSAFEGVAAIFCQVCIWASERFQQS